MLVFVVMTSLPALLYAIPVQMIFQEPGLETANEVNLLFLGLVSIWRISLLVWYLIRLTQLHPFVAVVAAAFPIGLIVVALTILNLEHVVFSIMSGISPDHISANDDIYMVMMMISMIAFYSAIPLVFTYGFTAVYRWTQATTTEVDPKPEMGV